MNNVTTLGTLPSGSAAPTTMAMLQARNLYPTLPPSYQSSAQTRPTLLVSWWMTVFSLIVIIIRVVGRYIRIERLFTEDKVMMASVVPLMARMALIHVVLIWGTNNTAVVDGMSMDEIGRREAGGRLVLGARVFYAVFIWMAKFTVCEFLKRVAGMIWSRALQLFLRFLYYFLASTLIAVVIATLAECHPFSHYWQVMPDPGAQCRSGYAHLITMGACNVVTDLLLVAFPIPIITRSLLLTAKRKVALVALFALSLILVGITCFRVPGVINRHGSQQFRSLLASVEILIATAVSNTVVIASFVRDKGVKKPRFERNESYASVNEGIGQASTRQTAITHHQWGSDSDLARDLGMRLDPELCSASDGRVVARYGPPGIGGTGRMKTACTGALDAGWSFGEDGGRRHSVAGVGIGASIGVSTVTDDESVVGISPMGTRKNSDAPLIAPPASLVRKPR